MTKLKRFFSVTLILFTAVIVAQKRDSTVVAFAIKFGNKPLELQKKYLSENRDTLEIDLFKCYVSNFHIEYADGSQFHNDSTAYLLDFENPKSFLIPICKKREAPVKKISFLIGVDSIASVSGALSGDLDPTKGMYWAWQSGYINMKIEGKSSSCKTRKNEFTFHIGGYLQPNCALRKIEFYPKLQTNSKIPITIDTAVLFSKLQLTATNTVMIPGQKAMELADYCVEMFKIE